VPFSELAISSGAASVVMVLNTFDSTRALAGRQKARNRKMVSRDLKQLRTIDP